MKTKIIILISVFLLPSMSFAQSAKEKVTAVFIVRSDSSNEVITHALIAPFSSVKSFDFLSSQATTKRFPNSENLVVAVVTLNPNVKLISLEDFYKRRKITNWKQKGLIVDGSTIPNTNSYDALIEESAVTSVDFKGENVKIETVSKDKLHALKPSQK
ncbi:hypothetical protein [Pedobacter sp. JCM 36344]|uniref:hypothetical protein n=1 Tax=Pedobacter sp. JCM 36344 TaxID=3374280 RepID=UPI0039797E3B